MYRCKVFANKTQPQDMIGCNSEFIIDKALILRKYTNSTENSTQYSTFRLTQKFLAILNDQTILILHQIMSSKQSNLQLCYTRNQWCKKSLLQRNGLCESCVQDFWWR